MQRFATEYWSVYKVCLILTNNNQQEEEANLSLVLCSLKPATEHEI